MNFDETLEKFKSLEEIVDWIEGNGIITTGEPLEFIFAEEGVCYEGQRTY